MVEFNYDKIPLYKLIVHLVQIVLSVTIWVLEIIVFRGGDINGQNGWTFGVVRIYIVYISCVIPADACFCDFCSASWPFQHGYI